MSLIIPAVADRRIIRASDPSFASVSLLLQANQGIVDKSSNAATITANNNAATSATQSKFAGLSFSMLNSGSNNGFFTSSTGTSFSVSGDFTLEMWVYCTTATGYDLISSHSANAATGYAFSINNSGNLQFSNLGVASITGTSTVSTGAWHHVACTRSGSTVRFFVDGVLDATSGANSTNYTGDTAGHVGYQALFQGSCAAYIDQVRVTNGVCRYTATFTAPTAPFPAN